MKDLCVFCGFGPISTANDGGNLVCFNPKCPFYMVRYHICNKKIVFGKSGPLLCSNCKK